MENKIKLMKASEILANARERVDAVEQSINITLNNRVEPEGE